MLPSNSPLSLLLLVSPLVAARLLHTLPEDPYAFPKYRVLFEDSLPLLNDTAERWVHEGLRGGELEFLDQPWKSDDWDGPASRKGIGSGEDRLEADAATSQAPNYTLEYLSLGPERPYLCFIPPPEEKPEAVEDPSADAVTPVHSWSLLQPLSGTCLYHRAGWFTYSYCHNKEIRQFRELPHTHPHPPGYQPEEDPDSESFTLGRAPQAPEPGADLTVAEQNALAANLELARGAGSRYLVQRWGDGTTCDKTGKQREVEVQFHCSMTMPDTILFVRETKTCSYVLVIHTPRLCGEPGFRNPLEERRETLLHCRPIVESIPPTGAFATPRPEHVHPFRPGRKLLAHADSQAGDDAKAQDAAAEGTHGAATKKAVDDLIRKALEAVLTKPQKIPGNGVFQTLIIEPGENDGEVRIEWVDEIPEGDEDAQQDADAALEAALRSAGWDIDGDTLKALPKTQQQQQPGQQQKSDASKPAGVDGDDQDGDQDDDRSHVRDEL